MEFMGVAGVAAIGVIAYLIGEAVKISPADNKYIPVICGTAGALLGVAPPYGGAKCKYSFGGGKNILKILIK